MVERRRGIAFGVLIPLFGPILAVVGLILLFGERRPLPLVRAAPPAAGVPQAALTPTATAAVVSPGRVPGDALTGSGTLGAASAPAGSAGSSVASPISPLLSRTVLDERFVEVRNGWPHDPRATAWFSDGAYRLFARQPGQGVGVRAPIAGPLADVVVTATFRKVSGPPGGGYGVIVRDQGPVGDGVGPGGRYYVLKVGDRGEVGIWRREEDRWIELLPWTPSAVVRPGEAANELVVRTTGPRLELLVNGTPVAEVQDGALSDGGVGIFAGGGGPERGHRRTGADSGPRGLVAVLLTATVPRYSARAASYQLCASTDEANWQRRIWRCRTA